MVLKDFFRCKFMAEVRDDDGKEYMIIETGTTSSGCRVENPQSGRQSLAGYPQNNWKLTKNIFDHY